MFSTLDSWEMPLNSTIFDSDERSWITVDVFQPNPWLVVSLICNSGEPKTLLMQSGLKEQFQELNSLGAGLIKCVQLMRPSLDKGLSIHRVSTLRTGTYLFEPDDPNSYQPADEYVFADGERFMHDSGTVVTGALLDIELLYQDAL